MGNRFTDNPFIHWYKNVPRAMGSFRELVFILHNTDYFESLLKEITKQDFEKSSCPVCEWCNEKYNVFIQGSDVVFVCLCPGVDKYGNPSETTETRISLKSVLFLYTSHFINNFRLSLSDSWDKWDKNGFIEYKRYISSDEWKEKSEWMKRSVGHRCQMCNRLHLPLNVHHRTYKRLGSEMPEDLIVLCRKCHEDFSKTHKYDHRTDTQYEPIGRKKVEIGKWEEVKRNGWKR